MVRQITHDFLLMFHSKQDTIVIRLIQSVARSSDVTETLWSPGQVL